MLRSTYARRLQRIAAGFSLFAAASAGAQGAPRTRPLSGIAYTIRVTGEPNASTGMLAAVADPARSYVASAVYAAGRGRLDITDGGVAPAFAKGDYVLFDSTGLVIVHPAKREFIIPPAQGGGPSMDQLQSMGVKIALSDLKVTLDSTLSIDTIAGYPARHFTLTTAYNMSVEAAGMLQRLATIATTDYWMASVPGLPGNPFLRANGFATAPVLTGVFKELSARIDSAAARMGSRVALRTVTASRLLQGPGSEVSMHQTSEVSDLHTRDVDESSLMLPAGFTQGPMPGAEPGARHGDEAARWRLPPRGRPR